MASTPLLRFLSVPTICRSRPGASRITRHRISPWAAAKQRNVNVALSVGTADQTVAVNAENIALAVTDSGERSFALSTKELENFIQVGSNAAEYIKIVPGFSVSNGTQNNANYTGQTIGINGNGDSGSQSPLNASSAYNGLPANSLGHRGRRRARLRSWVQLRYAGQPQL